MSPGELTGLIFFTAMMFFVGYFAGRIDSHDRVNTDQISYCTDVCEVRDGLTNVYVNGSCICNDGAEIIPPKESTK